MTQPPPAPDRQPGQGWAPPQGQPGPYPTGPYPPAPYPPAPYPTGPYGAPPQAGQQPPYYGQPQTWGTPQMMPAGVPQGDPVVVGAEIRGGVVTGLVLILLGAPLGLLWQALAPRPDYASIAVGSEAAFKAFFTSDLVLVAIMAVVGVLAGVAVRRPVRSASVGIPVGLVVGGLVSTYIAARTGVMARHPGSLPQYIQESFSKAHLSQPFSAFTPDQQKEFESEVSFGLAAKSVVVVAPIVSLLTLLAFRYLDRTHYLGRQPQLSSGSILPGQAPAPASH